MRGLLTAQQQRCLHYCPDPEAYYQGYADEDSALDRATGVAVKEMLRGML